MGKKLSVVVPVYYNSDTLVDLYEDLTRVLKTLDEYEIVFVDDGSGDNSWEIMNTFREKDKNVKCVKLSRNFGEHSAILAGLSVCTGDCAVTKQADLQEKSELILEMYESWQKGNDVVLAVRKDRQDSASTIFFANIYYKIINKFVNDKMPKDGCDCYLIDRKVIESLKNMKNTNMSMTLQVLWLGYKTDRVYFSRQAREKGKGRWTLAKKIKLAMDSLISYSYVPIRMTWMIGFLFFVFSIVMGISILVEYFTTGTDVAGWSSLMCVILCSSGLILLMLGMLGEYLWRTFESSLNRPAFVIDVINGEDKNE